MKKTVILAIMTKIIKKLKIISAKSASKIFQNHKNF